MVTLFFGSMGIFPLTQVSVRLMGRPGKVAHENRLWGLAALLVLMGTGLAMYDPAAFSTGGWLTSATLIAFAFAGRAVVLREEDRNRDRG